MVVLHAAGAPQVGGFLVAGAVAVALEHGEGQLILVDAQPLFAGQEFPAPGNHFLLEVIAQAPVAQHFKEGQVAHVTHVVDIDGADALLHVGEPVAGGVLLAQQVGHQGMHARGGEQHGGVVLRNDGGGGNHGVALHLEELQPQRAQVVRVYRAHGNQSPFLNVVGLFFEF